MTAGLPVNEILVGDALARLRGLPDNSVHCCVTSPPYWGLRDYGVDKWQGGDPACRHRRGNVRQDHSGPVDLGRGAQESARASATPHRAECPECGAVRTLTQLGLEPTPEAYVSRLVEVFREVRRVLHPSGTLWLVLGDCYATGAGSVGDCPGGGAQGAGWMGDVDRIRDDKRGYRGDRLANGRGDQPAVFRNKGNRGASHTMGPITQPNRMPLPGLKPKDLIGIPWKVAFALQADGWYLRSDIIYAKRNCMPESVQDRPTRAHEFIFLLSKSERYFYDSEAIAEPLSEVSIARLSQPTFDRQSGGPKDYGKEGGTNANRSARRALENLKFKHEGAARLGRESILNPSRLLYDADEAAEMLARGTRNSRSVWSVATTPFPEAHFAVFPEDLAAKCVLAGTSERGCCAACGEPWRRIVEKRARGRVRQRASGGLGTAVRREPLGLAPVGGEFQEGVVRTTTGWEPGCRCGAGMVPAVILDPFLGSGTTALVALKAGRTFVGVELNPEYAAMAERRIWQEKHQMRLEEASDGNGARGAQVPDVRGDGGQVQAQLEP